MKKRLLILTLFLSLALSLAACQRAQNETVNSNEISPSSTGNETAPEAPTNPQEPEQIEETSEEPESPAVIPDPVSYSGTGDSVLEIEPPDGMYVFKISGNPDGRHFAIKSYDKAGEYLDLLVNTTDSYAGTSLGSESGAAMLEISATGNWAVDLVSVYSMPTISSGETYSGTGDAVIQVKSSGLTADISGNDGAHHFAVKSYSDNWEYLDLLVNTTDPYDGTVMLQDTPDVLVITATGDWAITLG